MTARGRHVGHLARRFAGSLSRRPPAEVDEIWARSFLLPGEVALWARLGPVDRRHSIGVARRYERYVGRSPRDEMAAALLHDVGKLDVDLGTLARVVATVVGPRTARFRRYHQHEELGVRMLRQAGSSEATIAVLTGADPSSALLRAADDV